MELFLQIWGGIFYLFNKIFLAIGESSDNERNWKVAGWSVYLLGLPAWIIILVSHQDWIAAAIEAGGAPSMMLGLVVAWQGMESKPKKLKKAAKGFAYGLLTLGFFYSLYDFGGITSISQVLEIGVMVGFLIGTYKLANNNPSGWFFFGLMNLSMGVLMGIQGKPILMAQQIISLGFVAFGYYRSTKKKQSFA